VVGVLERFNLSVNIMEAYLPGNPQNLFILKTIYLISMVYELFVNTESYILAFFSGAVQLLELFDKSDGTGSESEPPLSPEILAVIR
jgi:hypothetical protein